MWGRRGRWSLYLFAGIAAIALLVGCIPAPPTNTAQLDDGRCSRNLQLGSDKNASSSNKPSFPLVADGGAASYYITIDGRLIGTFDGDPYGKVCIATTTALSDGTHTLGGKELRPNSSYDVAPYTFTVDTVPPPSPSKPVLDVVSDTAPTGDNATTKTQVRLDGTSGAGMPIQVYDGLKVIGGAIADGSGRWSVTTLTLARGTHSVAAVTTDTAGNKSAPSPILSLTIQ
jgi:hypothetical protein